MTAFINDSWRELQEIRETTVYSSRNASKGALIEELYSIVTSIPPALSKEKIREFIFEVNGLNKKTYENRRVIWNRLNHRYFHVCQNWIGPQLSLAAQKGMSSPEFLSFAYLYFCIRDRITFDFIVGPVWEKWHQGKTRIEPNNFMEFISCQSKSSPELKGWSYETQKKMASITLSAMRDFGLLRGKQVKYLQRPAISDETVFHLIAILWAEGHRGKAILQAPDWHLFLWEENDVANALSRLSQLGWVQFERSGQTMIFDVIREPEGINDA